MKLLNNTEQQKQSEHDAVRPFRSEVCSSIVGHATLKPTSFSGLRADGVQVSEFRLEQYLNACNPTCHG